MKDIGDKIFSASLGVVLSGAMLLGASYILKGCIIDQIKFYNNFSKDEVIINDLNNNNLSEKYIKIGNNECFLEVDGQPVRKYLK